MDVTPTLLQDHAVLRKKLAVMESALEVAPEARFVLRELCFSLLRLLQDHMRREAPALQRYTDETAGLQECPALDHAASHHLLRTVSELLLSGMRASMPTIVLRLSQVIEQLQAQMVQQERTVFAFLEQGGAVGAAHAEAISGEMSVNEILQRYPQTEQLFEGLHVNRMQEGYKSVDEFAWYHGMDVSKFLEQLRQAATTFPRF